MMYCIIRVDPHPLKASLLFTYIMEGPIVVHMEEGVKISGHKITPWMLFRTIK